MSVGHGTRTEFPSGTSNGYYATQLHARQDTRQDTPQNTCQEPTGVSDLKPAPTMTRMGLAKGRNKGYADGYMQGHQAGKEEGFELGEDAGYSQAKARGSSKSRTLGTCRQGRRGREEAGYTQGPPGLSLF